MVTDTRLQELASRLGQEQAQAFWGAGKLAMKQIESIVEELQIDCELKRIPAYLFAAVDADTDKEAKSLREDALIANSLGLMHRSSRATRSFSVQPSDFPIN